MENSTARLSRRGWRRKNTAPLAKDGSKHVPSLRNRRLVVAQNQTTEIQAAPIEDQIIEVRAAPVETQVPQNSVVMVTVDKINIPEIKVPDIVVPEIKVPDIVVPEIKIPDIVVPEIKVPDIVVPEIKVPDIVVPEIKIPDIVVPEIKVPPVVFNYDDKHLSTLTEILREVVETNRVKIEQIERSAKDSNQSADDATSYLKQILELTKDIQRPLATDGSEGDIPLDGGSALRFLRNIETKASNLGELQIVKDSLIDSGELLKFKTSTQDLIVALIAAVNQLFSDISKLHRDQIKSR